jgi:hypothetical protein
MRPKLFSLLIMLSLTALLFASRAAAVTVSISGAPASPIRIGDEFTVELPTSLDGTSVNIYGIFVSIQWDETVLEVVNFGDGACNAGANLTCSKDSIFGSPSTTNSLPVVAQPQFGFGDPPGTLRALVFGGATPGMGIAPVLDPFGVDTATFVRFKAIGFGVTNVTPILQSGDGIAVPDVPVPFNAVGAEVTVAPYPPQCSDGLDNDSDGLTDTSDPDCADSLDFTEFHVDPGDIVATSINPPGLWLVDGETGNGLQVGPLGTMALTSPFGLAFGRQGELYVTNGDQLLEVDLEAATTTVLAQDPLLENSRGVVQNPAGDNLYVATDSGTWSVNPSTGNVAIAGAIIGGCPIMWGDSPRFITATPDGMLAVTTDNYVWWVRPGTNCFPTDTVYRGQPTGIVLNGRGNDFQDFEALVIDDAPESGPAPPGDRDAIWHDEYIFSPLDRLGDVEWDEDPAGSPATSLTSPSGIARERSTGAILVADRGDSALYRIMMSPSSQETLLTGAEFIDVAVSPEVVPGDVIVVDYANKLVRVDPKTGEQWLVYSGSTLRAPFDSVVGVSASDNGIYVSNSGSNRGIQRIDPETQTATAFSPGGNFGVARYASVDRSNGDTLACKQSGSVIRVDRETGTQTVINSGASIGWCEGVTTNVRGEIFVSDRTGGTLVEIDPITGAETVLPGAAISTPIDIAFESTSDTAVPERIYYVESGTDYVRRRTLGGVDTYISTDPLIDTPRGISVGSSGNVWLADTALGLVKIDQSLAPNANARVFSPAGEFVTPIGATVVPQPTDRPGSDVDPRFGASLALNTNAATDSGEDTQVELATDDQGNWLAVWQSTDTLGGTIDADIDILVSTSTNSGATWSPPIPLNSNAASDVGDDQWPQIATDANGNWIVVWLSNEDVLGAIGTDVDILMARSSNLGATWTDPKFVNPNAEGTSGYDDDPISVSLATDGAGTWMAAWDDHKFDPFCCATASSASLDLGDTWSTPGVIDSGDELFLQFAISPTVATDGNGLWFSMASHTHVEGLDTVFDVAGHFSANDGDVWLGVNGGVPYSSVYGANLSGEGFDFGGLSYEIAGSSSGEWVSVWSSVADETTEATQGNWSDIFVTRMSSPGFSWSAAVPIEPDPAWDEWHDLNPTIAADDAGRFVVLWESQNPLGANLLGTDSDLIKSVSVDGGMTWSRPTALNASASTDTGADIAPVLVADSLGRWVAAWSSDDTQGGAIGSDSDILFARAAAPDSDGDDLADLEETNLYSSDPLDSDSDDDGLLDGIEVLAGLNPISADSDSDGLLDGVEDVNLNGLVDPGETDPGDDDSDDDGWTDGAEISAGTDPLDALSLPPSVPLAPIASLVLLGIGLGATGIRSSKLARHSVRPPSD